MNQPIVDKSAAGFAYRTAGEPAAMPVVFLHGIGGGARAFDPQIAALAARYRAIAWDAPGYGATTLPPTATIAELSLALDRFLDAAEIANPVLVGHSLGGMLVQDFLARNPTRTRAAVLVATSPAFGRADGDWQKAFIASRLDPLDAGRTMSDLAVSLVAAMVGSQPAAEGIGIAIRCMAATPEATYRVAVKSLVGFDQRAALAQITVPTLSIAGEVDPNAPADMMRKMAAKIPGGRFVVIPGVGHLPNLERPVEFNQILMSFLASLPETEWPA